MNQATTDQVLGLIADHIHDGNATPLEAETLASRLGCTVAEVDAVLRDCEAQELVRLVPTMEMANHGVQRLTAAGRHYVEHLGRDIATGGSM